MEQRSVRWCRASLTLRGRSLWRLWAISVRSVPLSMPLTTSGTSRRNMRFRGMVLVARRMRGDAFRSDQEEDLMDPICR